MFAPFASFASPSFREVPSIEIVGAMSFIGPSEAAKRLNVSRSSIQRWINSGKIRSFSTVGRHHRIRVKDLIEFAASIGLPINELTQVSPVTRVDHPTVTFGGILIVDDDPLSLEQIETQLASIFPYLEINKASSGFEAGIIAVTALPSLILVDLLMPGMDGVALCRMIRSNTFFDHVQVAAITGVPEGELWASFRAAGGGRIFSKPVDKCELCRYLGEHLAIANSPMEE